MDAPGDLKGVRDHLEGDTWFCKKVESVQRLADIASQTATEHESLITL